MVPLDCVLQKSASVHYFTKCVIVSNLLAVRRQPFLRLLLLVIKLPYSKQVKIKPIRKQKKKYRPAIQLELPAQSQGV